MVAPIIFCLTWKPKAWYEFHHIMADSQIAYSRKSKFFHFLWLHIQAGCSRLIGGPHHIMAADYLCHMNTSSMFFQLRLVKHRAHFLLFSLALYSP